MGALHLLKTLNAGETQRGDGGPSVLIFPLGGTINNYWIVTAKCQELPSYPTPVFSLKILSSFTSEVSFPLFTPGSLSTTLVLLKITRVQPAVRTWKKPLWPKRTFTKICKNLCVSERYQVLSQQAADTEGLKEMLGLSRGEVSMNNTENLRWI